MTRKPNPATVKRLIALVEFLDEFHLAGGQEVSFYALYGDGDRTLGEELDALRITLGSTNSVLR